MRSSLRLAATNIFPLILFLLISVLYFGLNTINHLDSAYVGTTDSTTSIWAFAWWKHCLQNGISPFFTKSVWYPYNYNLAQQPVLAWGNFILAAPLLFLFGPVITFNLSMLAAPALAGWTAFFLLKYLTRNYWASVFGAYFFGFSSYMIGHMMGHLMLVTVFLIPIIVLLIIKFYRYEMTNLTFCLLMGGCLAFQCYIECETFAALVVFGSISLCLAFLIFGKTKELLRVCNSLFISLLITVILILPFLILFFHSPQLDPKSIPTNLTNDLLSPLIPSTLFFISLGHTFNFTGTLSSYSEIYIGIPALIICLLYFREFWLSNTTKFLFWIFLIIFICSLGSQLHILGYPLVWLPWKLASHLPLIKSALPLRFGLFFSLCVSIIITYWLTDSRINPFIKKSLIIFSIIFLLPIFNFTHSPFSSSITPPKLISDELYKKWIKPNDVVIIIPYTYQGNAMLWQYESNMYFSLAGGYLGYIPKEFSKNPAVQAFVRYSIAINTNLASQTNLKLETQKFLINHYVKAIFVYANLSTWELFFKSLGMSPINIDGVDVYLTKNMTQPNIWFNFSNWHAVKNQEKNEWIWRSGNSQIQLRADKNGLITIVTTLNFIRTPRKITFLWNQKKFVLIKLDKPEISNHFNYSSKATNNNPNRLSVNSVGQLINLLLL